MPATKMKPEELNWAKKVYKTLHWNFPSADNDASQHPKANNGARANGHTRAQQDAPVPEPDLSDYVVVDEPAPESGKKDPSPIHRVMADIGLPESEDFRKRVDAYQAKFSAYRDDPTAAGYDDPNASIWGHRMTDFLEQSKEAADDVVRFKFRSDMKKESRSITREILETQAEDPKFKGFLKDASNKPPHELEKAHKQMLVFMAQNVRSIGEEIVNTHNVLQHQHAFGKAMSETLENARTQAVSKEDHDKLDAMEEEVIQYRMAIARELAMAMNSANDVRSAASFGETVESCMQEMSRKSGKINSAVASIGKLADQQVRKHLAKSNSAKATMKWARQQPWGKMVEVEIKPNGPIFDVNIGPRHAEHSDDPYSDGSVDQPHKELTKLDLNNAPELIYQGLRSPEMMKALSLKPTGEVGEDGIAYVEKPDTFALDWGNTLAEQKAAGGDISEQLPDFMELKQVRYKENKKGFFSSKTVEKTAWVVEQKDTSDTIAEVNLLKHLPGSIAGDFADLCDNMADLRKDQEEKLDEIIERKERLDEFLASKADGLLKIYGKAHDAMTTLRQNISDQVKKKIEGGTSIKKILKWSKEQPWSPMFDVQLPPCETGGYNIVIEDKQNADVKPLTETVHPKADTESLKEQPGVDGDDEYEAFGDQMGGLNGALKGLLNPSVYKLLISKPTNEPAVNGIPIVEEPSKFAQDWANLMLKAGGNLPDYLDIREVQYRRKSILFWKNNKLEVCKVLEFDPTAFKKAQRGK